MSAEQQSIGPATFYHNMYEKTISKIDDKIEAFALDKIPAQVWSTRHETGRGGFYTTETELEAEISEVLTKCGVDAERLYGQITLMRSAAYDSDKDIWVNEEYFKKAKPA